MEYRLARNLDPKRDPMMNSLGFVLPFHFLTFLALDSQGVHTQICPQTDKRDLKEILLFLAQVLGKD